ncbi:MAG: hypothetical protein GY842_23800 [bacterium]|nr:hypothetical protein [bacterium]
MDCVKCGAPLPAKSNICGYCGALNDTDLRAIHNGVRSGPATERICPDCDIRLQSVELDTQGRFIIERCDKCLGLFFDPNELESLVDASVSPTYEIDHQRMTLLVEEEGKIAPSSVRYRKCPVCRNIMNRRAQGTRSGVVVDTCKQHGVWLDAGELGQILKWAKAGGRMLDQQRKDEERRSEDRRRRVDAKVKAEEARIRARITGMPLGRADGLSGLVGLVARLLR